MNINVKETTLVRNRRTRKNDFITSMVGNQLQMCMFAVCDKERKDQMGLTALQNYYRPITDKLRFLSTNYRQTKCFVFNQTEN